MRVFLMCRDRDFDLAAPPAPQEDAVVQDLDLDTLFHAMAAEDKVVLAVVRRAILASLTAPEAILYRQEVLRDCLAEPNLVRSLFAIASDAIREERTVYFGLFRESPESILERSVKVLELFIAHLKNLRVLAEDYTGQVRSEGFRRLFAMLAEELSDAYFQEIEDHLGELHVRRGLLVSAGLGPGNIPDGFIPRRLPPATWAERLTFGAHGPGSSFRIAERDEAGFKALSALRDRGLNTVANALAQAVDHILSFFVTIRTELAFYLGSLTLHERLAAAGMPVAFPLPVNPDRPVLEAENLYDVCLALRVGKGVVGNDVRADGIDLAVITGANGGGKSTFLRSVGLAQLMMQCGLFVPAQSFRANVCSAVFTHFKREEDETMASGKLDEELARLSAMVDELRLGALLLSNESFASTNEREGSEIGWQIIHALLEGGVKVFFVTHLYDLARRLIEEARPGTLFLRAERQPDGRRTHRLIEAKPLPTSFGADAYRRVFGADAAVVPWGGDGGPPRHSRSCGETAETR